MIPITYCPPRYAYGISPQPNIRVKGAWKLDGGLPVEMPEPQVGLANQKSDNRR